jgi:hypothetical protein
MCHRCVTLGKCVVVGPKHAVLILFIIPYNYNEECDDRLSHAENEHYSDVMENESIHTRKKRTEFLLTNWLYDKRGSILGPETGYPDLGFSWVFFSPSRRVPREYLKLGHDRFFPNPLKLMFHLPPFHLALHILSY